MSRQEAFISKLLQLHQGQTVLAVTHNNPVRSLIASLKGVTFHDILNEYRIHNCSITRVALTNPKNVTFGVIDDVSHLNE